jgi:hypothetical protein
MAYRAGSMLLEQQVEDAGGRPYLLRRFMPLAFHPLVFICVPSASSADRLPTTMNRFFRSIGEG